MKVCSDCHRPLPLSDFYHRSDTESLRNECKACTKISNNRSRVKRLYGLDYEEYLQMLEGGCQICGKMTEDSKGKEVLSVDHHLPGQWRGILCNNCNRGIGYLMHDTSLLIKAAEYLKKTEESAQ